jgi:cell wall-associated NlpC family hydrolase
MIISCGGNKKVVTVTTNNPILDKYASILKTPKSEINNIKLYSFIDDWIGAKYKYGGMSKTGIDCSGFCNVLYAQVYNKAIKRRASDLSKDIDKVDKNKLKEGDLVFFNISQKQNSHVGVYLKNNRFVHASTSKGVMISSLDNPYYKKTYNKGGSL